MQNDPTSTPTINPEQAKRCLALCWKAERLAKKNNLPFNVPVVLVGATGTAKSSSIRQFATDLDGKNDKQFKYWHNPLSMFIDTGDFGVPVPDMKTKSMSFFTHGNIPFDCDDWGVVNFDEWDRSPDESVAITAATIALDREWHGIPVSPNAYICGTMNGTSDAQTQELAEFVRTRVVTLFMSRHSAGVVDSYAKFADAHGISPVAQTFAKFRRELIEKESEFEELSVCQSRTLDMADMVWQASKAATFSTDDIIYPCVAGCIGLKAATEYLAIERLIADAPDIDEILKNPDTAQIPEEASVVYALTCHLVDAAFSLDSTPGGKNKVAVTDSIATYGARLPDEYAAALFKRVSERVPRIVTRPAFQAWAATNKAILI